MLFSLRRNEQRMWVTVRSNCTAGLYMYTHVINVDTRAALYYYRRMLPKKAALQWTRVTWLTYTYSTINFLFLTSSVTSSIVHLMQIWFDYEQGIIDFVTDVHFGNCGRTCVTWHVHAGCGHFKHMVWNEFSFMSLIKTFLRSQRNLMHLTVIILIVDEKRWICVHMHFYSFKFNKVLQQH